ncbi:LysR family transcriptional regulator [Asaia sp. VD9]|uniref:LysR family transcriptional regulator n=1 Tax=Asaia sp. VD9 TaxID=3081235 RepID=UPI0030169D25
MTRASAPCTISGMIDTLVFRLKFRQLLLLRQISREPALNRAARSLNLSQPTASKLLQDMETDLEAQLFERHAHGLTPTRSGLVAIRHAEQILADLGRLRHDLQAVGRGLSGTVTIGTIGAPLHEIITPVLVSLAETEPELCVTLHVGTSDDLMNMLHAGRIDLAIGRAIEGIGSDLLLVEELASEQLLIVAGAQNPINERIPKTLHDLRDARWIIHTRPSPMRQAIETAFTLARLPLPSFPIELSSVTATIDLLSQSDMLAVVPRSIYKLFARSGILRELPVSLPDIMGSYSLIRLRNRTVTPEMDYLAGEIRGRAIGLSDNAIK